MIFSCFAIVNARFIRQMGIYYFMRVVNISGCAFIASNVHLDSEQRFQAEKQVKIPFKIQASKELTRADGMQAFLDLRAQAQANGVQDLSLDEIRQARSGGDK